MLLINLWWVQRPNFDDDVMLKAGNLYFEVIMKSINVDLLIIVQVRCIIIV